MMDEKKSADIAETTVNCDVCLKEIPAESEEYFESDDYVRHFCGIDCYKKWKAEQDDSQ